jgi:hypothetical protein
MSRYGQYSDSAPADNTQNWKPISEAADPHRILAEMFHVANERAEFILSFSSDVGTCGFAYVMIPVSQPMRKAMNGNFSIRDGFARVGARCGTFQSLHHQESVAKAMVSSLATNGIQAFIESRMD